MRKSTDAILTSHAGSLPRPDSLIEANHQREAGKADEASFQKSLTDAVSDVVRRQVAAGISVPGDGEYGKSMGSKVNYRAWWSYSFTRLGGLTIEDIDRDTMPVHRSTPGNTVLSTFADRRDRARFAAAYSDPEFGDHDGAAADELAVRVAPVTYTGHDAIAADIANFKAALAANGVSEGFMTSIGPASCARIGNRHYKSDDEFVFACAEAMREEYKAIVDAGLVLQIDDPGDRRELRPDQPRADRRGVPQVHHAEGRGAQSCAARPAQGPRPLPSLLGKLARPAHHRHRHARHRRRHARIDAGAYSFEAGNVRHEHEWAVWKDTRLPDDRLILPGVVSHATNVVEHPELVAERIGRFAGLVGRERVIASTDCGLGGRVHRDIAWAKLETLAQGAAIASKQLS